MTRYGYPTPAPEHTIVWDRNMTAWHRGDGAEAAAWYKTMYGKNAIA